MAVKNVQASFAGMSKKQHALLKKLDSRLKLYGKGQFALPINRFVESVSILCRGDDPLSWFAEDKTPLRILCRVKGLDEEGLAMHLTEMAKVFQWILWQPLLSDSKTHPERCWREEVYSTPSEFLIDQVDERHQQSLIQQCSERWDTCMMLGGATQVIQLIKQHIKKDNDALKSSIRDWMRDLKWHQEWDWERLAETAFFNKSGAFDTFWESDDYNVPERFAEHIVWRRKDRASSVIASVKKLLPNPYRTPGGDYGEDEKQERVCTPSPRRSARSSSVEKMKQSSLKRFFNSKKKAGSAKKAKRAVRKSNNKKIRARSAHKTLRKSRKRLSRRRSVSKKRSKSRSSGKKRSASKGRRSASKHKRSASRKRSVSRKRSSKKPSRRRAKSRSASKKGSKKRSRSASKKKRSRSASKKKRSASRKSSNKKSSKKRNSKSRSVSKKNRRRSVSKKKRAHRSASKTRSRSKKRSRSKSRSSSKRARRRVVKSRSRSATKAAKRRSASKH